MITPKKRKSMQIPFINMKSRELVVQNGDFELFPSTNFTILSSMIKIIGDNLYYLNDINN